MNRSRSGYKYIVSYCPAPKQFTHLKWGSQHEPIITRCIALTLHYLITIYVLLKKVCVQQCSELCCINEFIEYRGVFCIWVCKKDEATVIWMPFISTYLRNVRFRSLSGHFNRGLCVYRSGVFIRIHSAHISDTRVVSSTYYLCGCRIRAADT